MKISSLLLALLLSFSHSILQGQITSAFDYATDGRYVCLVDASTEMQGNAPQVTLNFLDANDNNNDFFDVYRRPLYGDGTDWLLVASNLSPGTASWVDTNVSLGDVWEYQVKRPNSTDTAIGYTTATVYYDQSNYRGQMILAISSDVTTEIPEKIERLMRDLTGDGWYVNMIETEKGNDAYTDQESIISVKNQITTVYNNAPANDKPQILFILGHVPLPRSGQDQQPPDGHDEFAGARGADCFYADIDGVFTDTATFNPGGLSNGLTINLPGDYKWDQDIIPSELEMAFGRVDFFRVIDNPDINEYSDISNYLDRLHDFRHVINGKIGNKVAFNSTGYTNSTYGSYRSLPSIAGGNQIMDSAINNDSGHNQWVADNGPFMIYMQNQWVPQIGEWNNIGMDAIVYSSDQSAWGYGDIPQYGGNFYSRIRRILRFDTECLIALWTTSAINIFHQGGTGDPFGIACKQIMNHNTTNQKLEKPITTWDTPDWWNRTHFSFYGDPSLRLFQTIPPSGLLANELSGQFTLSWTASDDENLLGYHVYKSSSEFGIYNKISGNTPISNTNFTDPNYSNGDWYMVRAIAEQTSGSGIFLNPSQGIFIQGDISLSNNNLSNSFEIKIIPNPSAHQVDISAKYPFDKIEILDNLGRVVMIIDRLNSQQYSLDISRLAKGNYYLKLSSKDDSSVKEFIKI